MFAPPQRGGTALVISLSGLKAEDDGVQRDWAWALAMPLLLGLVLWDGWFSRLDAVVLISLFILWLFVVIRHARRHAARNLEEIVEAGLVSPRKTLLMVLGGLALLVTAAQLVVEGGKGVALALGWSPFIVGAVVVTMAKGALELATTIISRLHGQQDVGLGNILGSNVFNTLFIEALAALIQPYPVKVPDLMPSLVFGIVTTLMILPGKGGRLERWRGFVLLALYAAYLTLTLQRGGSGH